MILILDSYILQSSTCFFCSGSIRSSNGALNTCHLTQKNTPLSASTEGPSSGWIQFEGFGPKTSMKTNELSPEPWDRWSWWFLFLFVWFRRGYISSPEKERKGTPWKIVPFFEYIISTKTCSWLLGESRAVSFQGRFAIYGYSHCPRWIFHRICTQGHRSQWKSDWTAMGWWVWVSPIPSCGGSIWHTLGSLGIQGHRNWGSEFGPPTTDLKHLIRRYLDWVSRDIMWLYVCTEYWNVRSWCIKHELGTKALSKCCLYHFVVIFTVKFEDNVIGWNQMTWNLVGIPILAYIRKSL